MTNAIIAGGGIAGTAAALALHRLGWHTEIHEARAEDADERGAFLTVAVNGIRALTALGLDPARVLAAGIATPHLRMTNSAGRELAVLPLGGPDAQGLTTTTIRRGDLYAALRAAVTEAGIPIHYGRRVDPDRLPAADLVVGADGINSRLRRALSPQTKPSYLGVLNVGGFTSGPIAADLDPAPGLVHMTFGRRSFFGWLRGPDGAVWWFANPASKRPLTGPAPAGFLDGMFDADTGPQAAIVKATPEILGPWNQYDLPRVPVWRSDRLVLIGDAAHAASPSSGQGASMAFEDAVILGRSLSGARSVTDGLRAYEQTRRDRVQRVVQAGRRNGGGKTAGRLGAAIRDAMMPAMMRILYRDGKNPQSWILDHQP